MKPVALRLRSNVAAIGFPRLPAGPSAAVAALVEQLLQTQWRSPEVIQAAQYGQLRDLATHLAHSTPSFARRLARSDLRPAELAHPTGLARLRPLTRAEVTDPAVFATSLPEDHHPVAEARTAGTVGPPVVVRRTSITALVNRAVTIRDHLWRGIDFSQRVLANRVGVQETVERPDWGPPVSGPYASGPLRATALARPIDELVAHIDEFEPNVVVLHTSVLDQLVALRPARPAGLEFVNTYAEPLTPALRRLTEARWGATVWDTYTCEEVGTIASRCPDGESHHVAAERVLVEILDDDNRPCPPGQIGRVVVTDLQNLATPLIRYELGDYAEVAPPCPCGRGLPTIGRVLGRERNRVRLPDGSWHWPEPAPLAAYRELAPVLSLQLRQTAPDVVEVVAVADRTVSAAEQDALSAAVHATLGHRFELRYDWRAEPPPRTPGGKFEPFVRSV